MSWKKTVEQLSGGELAQK